MKGLSGKYRHRLGRAGETRAADYLKSLGYTILSRNYRSAYGEIDIVAREGQTIVFAEVKTSTNRAFGEPEERVDRRKQRQIARVAEGYLKHHRIEDADCRFDVISVLRTEDDWRIQHFEDAFWSYNI